MGGWGMFKMRMRHAIHRGDDEDDVVVDNNNGPTCRPRAAQQQQHSAAAQTRCLAYAARACNMLANMISPKETRRHFTTRVREHETT